MESAVRELTAWSCGLAVLLAACDGAPTPRRDPPATEPREPAVDPSEAPEPDPGMTGATVRGDRVGPVRLGLTVEELRSAVPGARDTTFTLGEGIVERGLVVPLPGGPSALALIVDERVERVIVKDSGLRTDERLGVGSTLQELRQEYGPACAAPGEDGRAVVWFEGKPGISFRLDTGMPPGPGGAPGMDASRLSGSATVLELWVRRGTDTC